MQEPRPVHADGSPPRQWDHHGSILRGIGWTALFIVLGKLFSAAKEIAVAWRYGVGQEVDAYLFVFNTVTWPVSVWFAVLPVVLVPLVTRLRALPEGVELQQFRRELLGATLVAGTLLGLLTWLALRWLLGSPWTGLASPTRDIALAMAAAMALVTPLGYLVSLGSAWMLATGRYANTLYESVPALAILLAVLLWPGLGAAALVGGTLGGFAVQLVLVGVALALHGHLQAPRMSLRSPHWSSFWRGMGILLAGQALMSLTVLLDQFFAAGLHDGAVSTLGYANRILALIIGVGVTAVSRATLPVFAGAQTQDPAHTTRLALHWTRVLLGTGLLAIALGWWLAPWGVRLLFERGAFGPQDTLAVTEVLRHGLLQLPPYFAGIVLLSLLSARGQYRGLALVSAACLGCKLLGNWLLVPWAGLAGIQWSTSAMYLFYFAALCVLTVRGTSRIAPAAPRRETSGS
jgi:putative peptidoglycan lipid II flippase